VARQFTPSFRCVPFSPALKLTRSLRLRVRVTIWYISRLVDTPPPHFCGNTLSVHTWLNRRANYSFIPSDDDKNRYKIS
jgi:hypothetical protein